MKKTKILSVILAAAMLCALLSGCMGGKTVMKIGGNAISEEIYSAALSYADSFFQQNYGFSMKDAIDTELSEGTTGADMLKEQADGLVKEFESVVLYAKDKGIELTKDGVGVTPYHGGSYLYKAMATSASGQYAIEFVGLEAGEYTNVVLIG